MTPHHVARRWSVVRTAATPLRASRLGAVVEIVDRLPSMPSRTGWKRPAEAAPLKLIRTPLPAGASASVVSMSGDGRLALASRTSQTRSANARRSYALAGVAGSLTISGKKRRAHSTGLRACPTTSARRSRGPRPDCMRQSAVEAGRHYAGHVRPAARWPRRHWLPDRADSGARPSC